MSEGATNGAADMDAAMADIVRLAADVFDAPSALLVLCEGNAFRVASTVGPAAGKVPPAALAALLAERGITVVGDGRAVPDAFAGTVGFCASIRIEDDGAVTGALAVLDIRPRAGITARQRLLLEVLARQVLTHHRMHLALAERAAEVERVQDREARLRLVIDGARDYAILTLDADRRITSFSAGAERAFAMPAADAIGQLADVLFVPEDRAHHAAEREVEGAARDGAAPDVRWHQRADGGRVFIRGSVHPLPVGPDGRPQGFIKIGRDETVERAQAQALADTSDELAASLLRFRTLAEAAPALIFECDPQGRNLWVGERYKAFAGLGDEALLGEGYVDIVHPDDHAEMTVASAEAQRTAGGLEARLRLRRHDGEWRWHLCRSQPIHDAAGKVERMLGVCFDIDDAVRAAARLQSTERRLRALVTASSEDGHVPILLRADGAGHLLDAPGLAALTGRTNAVLLGRGWLRVVAGADRRVAIEAWRRARNAGTAARAELRLRLRDGAVRWYAWVLVPVADGEGELQEWVGTLTDVTARRAAEDALRELNATLEERVTAELAARMQAADALAEAQERLRQSQKMEAIGQLTGGVAHDFNNLLTVIRSSADLLRREGLPEERRRRYVDAIADTTERAAKLTRQLLSFSRRQSLRPEVFAADARVRGVTDMLRGAIGDRVALDVELQCDACLVEADPNEFDTALVNLAVNARDAMDGEGQVRIAVTAVDALPPVRGHAGAAAPFVRVTVADHGAGIAAADLTRIFEPFFTTKEVGRGTGLGLSQVYGFAKQSGGDIDVESMPGVGTTFTLYLPRTARALPPPAPVSTGALRPVPAARGRVLVVEDNIAVGEFATQLLADLGFETLRAGNGAEALALLGRGERVDIVFTDVVMAGMNGVDLARRIASLRPGLPVVLTSGYSQALTEQPSDLPLLRKPYSVEELSAILRAQLDAGAGGD